MTLMRRSRALRPVRAARWIARRPTLRLALPIVAVVLGLGRWAPRLLDLLGYASFAVSAVLLAVAVPVAAWGCLGIVRRALIRRRLLRTGTPAMGRVVAAQAYGLLIPTMDDVVEVELVLDVISGTPPRRLELRETIDADAQPAVGDVVRLLIDPRRPDRFRLAPFTSRAGADGPDGPGS